MISCNCSMAGTSTCRGCLRRKQENAEHYTDKMAFTMLFEQPTYTGTHDNVFVTRKKEPTISIGMLSYLLEAQEEEKRKKEKKSE